MLFIQHGNDTTLRIQPLLTDGTAIAAETLQDIAIQIGIPGQPLIACNHSVQYGSIVIPLPATLEVGTYDIYMRGRLGSRAVEDDRQAAFCIVSYGNQIAYDSYCTPMYIVGTTTDELTEMLRAAEEAREQYLFFQEKAEAEHAKYTSQVERAIANMGDLSMLQDAVNALGYVGVPVMATEEEQAEALQDLSSRF